MGGNGADLSPFGYFSVPKSIGVDDPYVKKLPPDARYSGKQLQTSPSKRGQTGDNWNKGTHALKGLFEKEKYEDPGAWERRERKAKMDKNITKDGFKPSSPAKKWSGLGSQYGCIGPQLEHKDDGYDKRQKKLPEPRQVQTSPPKKGSFGYIGTTLGKLPEYKGDTYDRPHQLELEERQLHQKKLLGGAFRSMSHSVDYFDTYPNVAASKVYTMDRAMPPAKARPSTAPEIKVPFVPSHIPKIGHNATLNAFPEYKESPYDSYQKKQREEAQ
eukprot:TRINITY_DN128_c0_g1_i3.p1 TRINITY_DN128_c0_g1~~TRINITY_DN128_c0_g1_i3.p1  ORF type:complete len:272 (-),score=56.85 TRINITY_DN128_c0_g1_i3:957-1772(-)